MAQKTREDAHRLLRKYIQNSALRTHAYAVEATMRYFAREYGENEEEWGIIGLLHDLDWEQFPQDHCKVTEKILREEAYPESYITAILSHGWNICTEVKPQKVMEKVLYAIDELTGLIIATALVRPSQSLLDTKVSSVKKKWKSSRFAAGVNRDVIQQGADMLDMDLDILIKKTLTALQGAAASLGLDGSQAANA